MHWPLRFGMLTLLAVLPGCLRATLWQDRTDATAAQTQRQSAALDGAKPPSPTIIIRQATAEERHRHEPVPEADSLLTLPTSREPPPVPFGAEGAGKSDLQPTPSQGSESQKPDVTTAAKAEELNRLLRALKAFLEDRPDEALQLLKQYPVKDQELLLTLLPVVAGVERKGAWTERLEPAQRLAVIDTLQSLTAALEPSVPLIIKKVVFVRNVQGFGRYEPLLSPTFRPGDPVSLYLEIENLHDQRVNEERYVVRLGSLLTIRQEGTNQGWQRTVPATPDWSRSPRKDHHAVISFQIPSKEPPPPGAYALLIEITDLDTRRSAEKVISFRISNQAGEASSARR